MELLSFVSGSRAYCKISQIPNMGIVWRQDLALNHYACSFYGVGKSRVCYRSLLKCGIGRLPVNTRLARSEGEFQVQIGGALGVRCENFVGKKRIAVFVSGGGSNFKSIYEASLKGKWSGNVVVVVTNKPDCGGAEYARDNDIPVVVFSQKRDEKERLSASELVDSLRRYNVDFILLAGYLKLIPIELIRAYPKSILNIHPSLLPAFGGKGFYGMKVHSAVIASGARYSGPTIHFVDENFDTGRIVAQRVVPVLATDTAHDLAARVLHEEHKLYVEVITALCEGRIVWREDGVPLIQSRENPKEYS